MGSPDLDKMKDAVVENRYKEPGQKEAELCEQLGKHMSVHDNMEKLQNFTTPASITGGPPTAVYPGRLSRPSTQKSLISSPKDFNRNPYTEADYAPKRFRPEECERDSPGDDDLVKVAMSSSRAWLPPEHPDELLEGEDVPVSPTAFSRSANDYTGAVLHPGQLSSITTYGFPGGAFKKTTTTGGASTNLPSPLESHQRQSQVGNPIDRDAGLEGFCNSPETSSSEIQANSGEPLTQPNQASTTFASRARQAGISEWNEKVTKGLTGNNSIFDGRWVLNPSEAWNVPVRRTSSLTISPEGKSSDRGSKHGTAAEQTVSSINVADRMKGCLEEGVLRGGAASNDQAHPDLLQLDDGQAHSNKAQLHATDSQNDKVKLDDPKRLENPWHSSIEVDNVADAEESLRFEEYVTDLSLANSGLRITLESYDPASIYRMFCSRVFGIEDPQLPYAEDARKLVRYKGKVVTKRELYLDLFREIKELVACMTAPSGQKALQKLAPECDVVRDGNSGRFELIRRDTVPNFDPTETYHSGRQLQLQPQIPPIQKQVSSAENRQSQEQLENRTKPSRADLTASASAVLDPSCCDFVPNDFISTTNPQPRPHSGLGDSATPEINAVSAIDNIDFPSGQNIVASIHDVRSSVESNALFSHPGSSTTHSTAIAATNGPFVNATAPSIAPINAYFQDEYGQVFWEQRHAIPARVVDRQGHHLYGFPQESASQGTVLAASPHGSHSQPFPPNYAQSQALLPPQAQGRIQLSAYAQAQTQIIAQTQHHAEPPSQPLGLPRQISPIDVQNVIFNVPGQQIQSQAHSFVASPHTLGFQRYGPHGSDQNTPKPMMAGQYYPWPHQSLPPHPRYQQRTFNEAHGSELFTSTGAAQPYNIIPGVSFQPQIQHGAVPGPTAQSYVQPYIPADKYARAPAPNRIASRFAQAHAFQVVNSKLPVNSSLMQTHYPTPVQNQSAKLAALSYRVGSDKMYPTQLPGVASIRFQDLTRDEPPRFAVAGDGNYIPFIETTSLSKPAEWGVLRVSNMPYDITRELVHAFLGTHAKTITPDLGPCIHIMMDRSTGKTQDCYIEFFSVPDARAWHTVIVRRGPHLNKIGDRILEVELSSQEELMKELFPRARCVVWNGSNGLQVSETEEAFDSGFKGFIMQEELKGLIHHAEQPHRSLYTQKCPPRPYTNLISILAKFPWHATQHYTLSTRNALYSATHTLVKTLTSFLRRSSSSSLSSGGHHRIQHSNNASLDSSLSATLNLFRPDLSASELSRLDMRDKGLNESLLKELVLAGMNAYGFSDRQRWELYVAAAGVLGKQWMRLSPLMSRWPWEAVGRKAGWEEDVVEFYAHLLSSSFSSSHPSLSTSASTFPPHTLQDNGGNNTALYEHSLSGYKTGTVTMAALGDWEMGLIRDGIRARCVT